ncbi:hypothetical protein JCM5353_008256 [Sporobolomyces roseus]
MISIDAPAAMMDTARLSLAARFTHVACSSVYFYDTIVVFKEDYRLIWLAQPSLFKYLAIMVRLNGLVNAALTLSAFLGGLSYDSKGCMPLALAMVTFCSAACLNGAYVLALRAAAMYAFRTSVVITLACAVLVQTICLAFATSRFKTLALPRGVTGCVPGPPADERWYIFLWLAPMVAVDLLTFSLTTSKALKLHRASQGASTLADILIRDGVMVSCSFSTFERLTYLLDPLSPASQYYALVLITTTATMVAFYTSRLGPTLQPFATVLSPLFVCHLCLNLRAISSPAPSSNKSAPRSLSHPGGADLSDESPTVESYLRRHCPSNQPNRNVVDTFSMARFRQPSFGMRGSTKRPSMSTVRSSERSDGATLVERRLSEA